MSESIKISPKVLRVTELVLGLAVAVSGIGVSLYRVDAQEAQLVHLADEIELIKKDQAEILSRVSYISGRMAWCCGPVEEQSLGKEGYTNEGRQVCEIVGEGG